MEKLVRSISYFSKKTGELAGEIILSNVNISVLQSIFDMPEDEPMIHMFEIDEAKALRLKEIIDFNWDMETFAYYLDCYLEKEHD